MRAFLPFHAAADLVNVAGLALLGHRHFLRYGVARGWLTGADLFCHGRRRSCGWLPVPLHRD
jgi:hypothetical protein